MDDLNGSDFTWVGSAYSLACAACLPFNGNLAQVFGRRPVLLVALTVFAVGSAVSAAAPSMSVLIGGRGVSSLFSFCEFVAEHHMQLYKVLAVVESSH